MYHYNWHQIPSSCQNNTYGPNCSMTCHCYAEAECTVSTGQCPNNCSNGYSGIDCQIANNTKCPKNQFGISSNCTGDCHCLAGANNCSSRTGICMNMQCDLGWMGYNCQEECRSGYYGPNCINRCFCFEDIHCNRFNGNCEIPYNSIYVELAVSLSIAAAVAIIFLVLCLIYRLKWDPASRSNLSLSRLPPPSYHSNPHLSALSAYANGQYDQGRELPPSYEVALRSNSVYSDGSHQPQRSAHSSRISRHLNERRTRNAPTSVGNNERSAINNTTDTVLMTHLENSAHIAEHAHQRQIANVSETQQQRHVLPENEAGCTSGTGQSNINEPSNLRSVHNSHTNRQNYNRNTLSLPPKPLPNVAGSNCHQNSNRKRLYRDRLM